MLPLGAIFRVEAIFSPDLCFLGAKGRCPLGVNGRRSKKKRCAK
jgi:hypothetical protein